MSRFARFISLCAILCGLLLAVGVEPARAQAPVAVTTYYPATPTVTYVPERRGLFGRRIVYRPIVTMSAPAPVTTYYAPSTTVVERPITTYYAPATTVVERPITTFYAPPTTVVERPVTTFYRAPGVTTYYSPIIVP